MVEPDFKIWSALIAAGLFGGIYAVALDKLNRWFLLWWAASVPLMMFKATMWYGIAILVAIAIYAVASLISDHS